MGVVPGSSWLLIALAATVAAYTVLICMMVILGRRAEATAMARFIPDCVILLHALIRDERVPRRRKLVLLALVAYLSIPIDLVPDFIPIAGQLDDILIAAAALRYALRSGGPSLLREHWPGPDASLGAVMRVAYGPTWRSAALSP
jgi:uncharacterized membrane protein YkvA (DUF1232 family)